MTQRHRTRRVLEALQDTPVVYIHGARQTGKSPLVQAVAKGPHRARYYTLDAAAILADLVGERFRQGFVLHTGDSAVSFQKNLHALPVEYLWR